MEAVLPAHVGLRCANPTCKTSLLAQGRTIEINSRQHLGETKLPRIIQPEDGVLICAYARTVRPNTGIDTCASTRKMHRMHSTQLALIRQAIFVTVLLAIAPKPVFPATGMVNISLANATSNSLLSNAVNVLSLNISRGRNTALNQLFVSKNHTYRNLNKIALEWQL